MHRPVLYEEVVIFFLDEPGMEPQPEAASNRPMEGRRSLNCANRLRHLTHILIRILAIFWNLDRHRRHGQPNRRLPLNDKGVQIGQLVMGQGAVLGIVV